MYSALFVSVGSNGVFSFQLAVSVDAMTENWLLTTDDSGLRAQGSASFFIEFCEQVCSIDGPAGQHGVSSQRAAFSNDRDVCG